MGIYLPAIPILARVFNASITEINATISVFMVVLAVAPLFWASYADYGGRKTLYMISIPIYTISNILMAALPANIAALFILRIVQAFGAASVISLAAGTVADITEPKRRASAMSIVLLGPQGGPVLGPILGGALVSANWRWIFGFLAIASFVIFLLLVFCLPETLRSLVGNGSVYAESSWVTRPQFRQPCVVDSSKFPKPPRPTLIGLFKLLREPPLLFLSLNSALLFAAYYAMNVTLSPFLQTEYGFSAAEAGVAYLAPGESFRMLPSLEDQAPD
ncbi:MAG: Dityrosine transporter 1 [Caeruleum heppii]|nr:MAG: Dityrosine transporter 1 [Caeruleum heppii]